MMDGRGTGLWHDSRGHESIPEGGYEDKFGGGNGGREIGEVAWETDLGVDRHHPAGVRFRPPRVELLWMRHHLPDKDDKVL